MTGCNRDPVRPSKIPQSGPAAEANSDVAVHMAAVAKAALDETEGGVRGAVSLLLLSLSFSLGDNDAAKTTLRDGVCTEAGWGAVKAEALEETRARTNNEVFMVVNFFCVERRMTEAKDDIENGLLMQQT